MLKKELNIFTFHDLLEHYPLRHIDKTVVGKIRDISGATDFIQVAGTITDVEIIGAKGAKRMVAELKDDTGYLELVWFQGIHWVQKILEAGKDYLVYGRVGFFNGKPQITHPEIESLTEGTGEGKNYLEPVYPTTEKLKAKSLNGRQIGKLTAALLPQLSEKDIPENIPTVITGKLKLVNRFNASCDIHFPKNLHNYNEALKRLKFEELFLAQIRLQLTKLKRHRSSKGVVFEKVGKLFNDFYSNYLPFELTGAQK
ncbi:MAG TPA: OB-fold nucleic acid binding domain-containing protein, partial [Chitinophagaceae bacterium]|nr:OB-fold nucleic acid binding domain-containing protein [Chitinophagaceae bacterium]